MTQALPATPDLLEPIYKNSDTLHIQLIQNLLTPLYTTDMEGRITLFNKAASDLWGREPEIGKELWCGSYKIYNPDGSDLPFDECPMAVCLREKRAVLGEEILIVRPDGSICHVAPHPQPLYDNDGNMIGAVNMLVDITASKEASLSFVANEHRSRELTSSLEKNVEETTKDLLRKNEELKESEERYHKMIEEVEDYAIILLDKNGIIQNWNKGAENIKGYKSDEIIGQSFEVFYSKGDREAGLPLKLIAEAKENGKAIAEGWRMKKDGSRFWGSIVITALHNDAGDIIGFSKVTRDLTERKQAEDKLKEYSNELEFQNSELEQFVYAASHDMKEPLRKIHLYNSYVKESAAGKLDPKSLDYLDRSVMAVKRMSDLIEDLLVYSKTTSNVESISRVDLNVVMDDIISLHKVEQEQNSVRIIRGDLPVLKAIPFQCKQLLDNLVNNSIKYKHPDRDCIIEVTSEVVRGSEIKGEKTELSRNYYKISVADNGIGFEPEYARKIFEIFQRLNNQSGSKGSGIGLAICKKIMQNHKGYIVANGKLKEGATFHIYFPVDQ